MTKAEKLYLSDEDPKERYNQLLEMWTKSKSYSEIHTLTKPQEEGFYDIPKYLSKLLDEIEPDPKKRIVREVFEGFVY